MALVVGFRFLVSVFWVVLNLLSFSYFFLVFFSLFFCIFKILVCVVSCTCFFLIIFRYLFDRAVVDLTHFKTSFNLFTLVLHHP